MWIYLCEREGQIPSSAQDMAAVDKYQPASRILRQVFFHYQNWGNFLIFQGNPLSQPFSICCVRFADCNHNFSQ